MKIVRYGLLASMMGVLTVVGVSGCSVGVGGGGSDPYASGTVVIGGACYDDRDCLSGDYCDPVDGLCVAGGAEGTVALDGACTYDAECLAGDVCDASGVCVADPYAAGSQSSGLPCDWDADCADSFCDLDTHTCA